jgi:anti-sigma B factor antagonist
MIPGPGATDIRVDEREGVPVAVLEGDIDIANASLVRERLFGLLTAQPQALIVDLSSVTYIDSRGVHVLLELAERMKIRHRALRLVVPDSALIKRILQLTHLDAIVPLDQTVGDAAAHVRAG